MAFPCSKLFAEASRCPSSWYLVWKEKPQGMSDLMGLDYTELFLDPALSDTVVLAVRYIRELHFHSPSQLLEEGLHLRKGQTSSFELEPISRLPALTQGHWSLPPPPLVHSQRQPEQLPLHVELLKAQNLKLTAGHF